MRKIYNWNCCLFIMERRKLIGVGVVVVALLLIFLGLLEEEVVEEVAPVVIPEPVSVPASVPVPVPTSTVVNFQKYNIDYMNDGIKAILVGQAGANGKTAFYLPSTGYVNVTRGTKYGVAWLINNVNPKVPEGSEFSFNFNVNSESVADCGVSVDVAQGWIERGMASTGMISGQWREDWNEWHDAMTIYFAFPDDIEACSVKYDFVITKDGGAYDSRSLLFNLV
jgi:hypothetical protein